MQQLETFTIERGFVQQVAVPVQKPWQELPAEFTSAVFLLEEVLRKGAEDAFVVLVFRFCTPAGGYCWHGLPLFRQV